MPSPGDDDGPPAARKPWW